MACRGVHFAITQGDADRLLRATSDESVLEIVQEDIEQRWDEGWLYESDKAWDAIHRCLTDGSLDQDGGTYPLKLAILGGKQLHAGDHYIISLVTPGEVRDVASQLSKIDMNWLRQQYNAIDPEQYGMPKSEDDWQYTWDYYAGLPEFFSRAARADRYVIFTVDQ